MEENSKVELRHYDPINEEYVVIEADAPMFIEDYARLFRRFLGGLGFYDETVDKYIKDPSAEK